MTIHEDSGRSRQNHATLALDPHLVELIGSKDAVKAIATSDDSGVPHVALAPWIALAETGELVHLEPHLDSTSSRNMIHSLWFNRTVSVAIGNPHGRSWHITGIPVKAHVCGPVFQRYYVQIRSEFGDIDLAAVYLIRILSVQEESIGVRQQEEDAAHPFYRHLDRLVVQENSTASLQR